MPTFTVQTNVPLTDDARTALLKELSSTLAMKLGKPEAYVMVSYQHAAMMFGGSADPCAFCNLHSIGKISLETNPGVSSAMMSVLETHLCVHPNRCYIQFVDSERHNFGWDSTVF